MDQSNYPKIDKAQSYESYPDNYYNYVPPPPASSVNPELPINNLYPQPELKQPLVIDYQEKQNKHHGRRWVRTLKRRVSAVIGLVCLAIELGMIYYIKNSSSLFKYCYWEFGVEEYDKIVDQELYDLNSNSNTDDFESQLGCYNDFFMFHECPEICSLAEYYYYFSHLDQFNVYRFIVFGELGMVALVISLISASFYDRPKLKLKKWIVALFGFVSFGLFFGSCWYTAHRFDYFDLGDPDYSKIANVTSDWEYPTEFEISQGGVILILLIGFMLIYRIALVWLAKR